MNPSSKRKVSFLLITSLIFALFGFNQSYADVGGEDALPFLRSVDTPVDDSNFINSLVVSGWALYDKDGSSALGNIVMTLKWVSALPSTSDGINTADTQEDLIVTIEPEDRYLRADVQAAITGYSGESYSTCGYQGVFTPDELDSEGVDPDEVDPEGFIDGIYSLTIDFYDTYGNSLGTVSINLTRDQSAPLPMRYTIDSPTANQNISDTVTVSGWALYGPVKDIDGIDTSALGDIVMTLESDASDSAIGINASGNQTIQLVIIEPDDRYQRTDVASAVLGYGDYSTCGFSGVFDALGISDGNYKLTIEFFDADATEDDSPLDSVCIDLIKNENAPLPLMYAIDSPTANQNINDSVTVTGWALYGTATGSSALGDIVMTLESGASGSANIANASDNQTVNPVIIKPSIRSERTDVANAILGYGDYSTCGFSGVIDTSLISNGNYKLKIEFFDTSGDSLGIFYRNISRSGSELLPLRYNIESPVSDQSVTNSVIVGGWVLQSYGEEEDLIGNIVINVFDSNDVEIGSLKQTLTPGKRFHRQDVEDDNLGYCGYETCGFYSTLDFCNLVNGDYTIVITINSGNARFGITQTEISVPITKNSSSAMPFIGFIDAPEYGKSVQSGKLTVSGWGLRSFSGTKNNIDRVTVEVEGSSKAPVNAVLSKRSDLFTTIPGYGNTADDYVNSGFSAEVDLSGLSGSQIIVIKFYNGGTTLVGTLGTRVTVIAPTPTPVTTPTPVQTPTPDPTPTPTSNPSSTPSPRPTVIPSSTPTPTKKPSTTATPKPTAVPSPTPTSSGTVSSYAVKTTVSNVEPPAGSPVTVTFTVYNSKNTVDTAFEGTHNITVSGVKPNSSNKYGSFNLVTLNSTSSSGQIIPVSFVRGQAVVQLLLYSAEKQTLTFRVQDLVNPMTSLAMTPVPSGPSVIAIIKEPAANQAKGGGVLITQPQLSLTDDSGNMCIYYTGAVTATLTSASDSSVYLIDASDDSVYNTQKANSYAYNGVVTFSSLGIRTTKQGDETVKAQLVFTTDEGVSVTSRELTINKNVYTITVTAPENTVTNPAGDTPLKIQLTAKLIEGDSTPSVIKPTFAWTISPNPVTGISVDDKGLLTVTKEAAAGRITVKASYAGVDGVVTITLNPAPTPTPAPTATPEPTATPSAAPTPTGTAAASTIEGAEYEQPVSLTVLYKNLLSSLKPLK